MFPFLTKEDTDNHRLINFVFFEAYLLVATTAALCTKVMMGV